MSLSIYIPPYAEPVSLNEMKGHLKVETAVTDDDVLIQSQISAARDVIETMTGANVPRHRVMLATTFEVMLQQLPWWTDGYIPIPRVPLVSVDSVAYVDNAGDTQTLAASVYSVDLAEGLIRLAYNQNWPSVRYQPNAVTVRFVAGMAAPFTAVAATDVLTVQGRAFTIGDRVRVMNSGGALPTGLLANTDYFVIAGGKLSLTSGGAAVDITGIGSGTHFIGGDLTAFETGRAAIKLTAAHLYVNREAVVIGAFGGLAELPMAVRSLISSIHA